MITEAIAADAARDGMMDHVFFEKIAEGAPLIVLLLVAGIVMLWRALREEQKARDAQARESFALQRETLVAMGNFDANIQKNTAATEALTAAIRGSK